MEYQYNIVQFTAQLKGGMLGTKGESIESQFQAFINRNTIQGWEFDGVETVHAYVKAGCLASLIGRKDKVLYQDVVVFRKPK